MTKFLHLSENYSIFFGKANVQLENICFTQMFPQEYILPLHFNEL